MVRSNEAFFTAWSTFPSSSSWAWKMWPKHLYRYVYLLLPVVLSCMSCTSWFCHSQLPLDRSLHSSNFGYYTNFVNNLELLPPCLCMYTSVATISRSFSLIPRPLPNFILKLSVEKIQGFSTAARQNLVVAWEWGYLSLSIPKSTSRCSYKSSGIQLNNIN